MLAVVDESVAVGSHLVPLVSCLACTKGSILEVGVGNWSTPFLSLYCKASGRELSSVDSHEVWVDKYPQTTLIDYDDVLPKLAIKLWSIVLLDHWPPTRRINDALLFKKSTYVLVHDWPKLISKHHVDPLLVRPWKHNKVDSNTLVLWN